MWLENHIGGVCFLRSPAVLAGFLFHRQPLGKLSVRLGQNGAIGRVDHHARPGAGWLFYILYRGVVHGNLTAIPAL